MASVNDIHVILERLSGEAAECTIAADASVADLKTKVRELWDWPITFQILLADAQPLTGSTELIQFKSDDDDALLVTSILSVEAIDDAISTFCNDRIDVSERMEALTNLAMLGPSDLRTCTCSVRMDEVTRTACRLLNEVISSASKSAHRAVALAAVTRLADRGNAQAIEAVVACLGNEDLRMTAISSLSKIAATGDAHAIWCLSSMLNHDDADVCIAALQELGKFVGKGYPGASMRVCQLLTDADDEVRWQAVETLHRLITSNDTFALAHVSALHTHPDFAVRCAALAVTEVLQS
jgi:HEAT repeat protein